MPRVLVEVVASKGATVLRATPESSPVLRKLLSIGHDSKEQYFEATIQGIYAMQKLASCPVVQSMLRELHGVPCHG